MQDKINAANNSIKIKLKLNCHGLVLHHYAFKDLQNEKKTLSKGLTYKKFKQFFQLGCTKQE